jgi:hypothetical protein
LFPICNKVSLKEAAYPAPQSFVLRRECTMRRMSETHASTEDHDEPGRYEIRIKGHLDDRWADWFEGLSFTHESDGTTILAGPVVDQAALHGWLRKVRDLGLPLVSVIHVSAWAAIAAVPVFAWELTLAIWLIAVALLHLKVSRKRS